MEPTPPEPRSNPVDDKPNGRQEPLESIRAILLHQERARVERLEADALEKQALIDELRAELEAVDARQHALREELTATDDAVLPRVEDSLPAVTRGAVAEQADEMAEAIGPIMGRAVQVQIRESSDELSNALAPIILGTVVVVIRDALSDIQRQIDARLSQPRQRIRMLLARLRGVSPAEMAMRDAMPFQVHELFLIQHASGLLLGHYSDEDRGTDSDLVSGMLTAIRDFVGDSFAQDGQADDKLDAIGYGNQQIVIRSGSAAYVAVVLEGVEPTGLRRAMQRFITQVHAQHGSAMAAYTGDPASIPSFRPMLAQLATDIGALDSADNALTTDPRQRRFVLLGLLGLVFFSMVACFYLWFTMQLLPLALGNAPVAAPVTVVITATPTEEPPPTPTLAPIATPRSALPLASRVTNDVWVRADPGPDGTLLAIVSAETRVVVQAVAGDWAQVEWRNDDEVAAIGWMPVRWLADTDQLPDS